ncbi:hypothetical protein GEOBC_00484 [Geobacteraceae bacterium]|nr:hypothetical protein GEOBC_00484 [Geobacteraceae bacterium]
MKTNMLKTVKKWIYRDYFTPKTRILNRFNAKWLLRYSNYIDRKLILGELYECNQLEFCNMLIAKNNISIFIDIGSNFGLYSIILTVNNPNLSKIFSFEPDVVNYNHLCSNIFLNNLNQKVKTHALGLSNHKGEIEFLRNKGNSTGQSRIAETAPDTTKSQNFIIEKITIDTLDDSLNAINGERVLVKIDVEGHEMEVCAGAVNFFQNNHCYIQMELLNNHENKCNTLCEQYNLKLIHRIESDFYFESGV